MFEPLTNARREFLARSVMDMLKYVLAAALASGFFLALGTSIRVALGIAFPIFFFLAWVLFPPRKEE